MIHQPLSPDGVHPPNQFVPETVCPLPCSPRHVSHKLPFVYFFKELVTFIGYLDKCHTSVFNALILKWAMSSNLAVERTLSLKFLIKRTGS